MVNFTTKQAIRHSVALAVLALILHLPAQAQNILPDGTTATNVSSFGSTTDITTATVKGKNAFNSFRRFNVDPNTTVNLILPGNTDNLINLVHAEASHINGTLNSLKNNTVGGNIYLVNPYGVVVGAAGKINTGSLVVTAPTQNFMSEYLNADGTISDCFVQRLMSGNYKVNPDSVISIQGEVNAVDSISLAAGNIVNQGNLNSGAVYSVNYDSQNNLVNDIVNLNSADRPKDVVVKSGQILIVSINDIVQDGTIITGNLEMQADGSVVIPENSAGQIIANSVDVSAASINGPLYLDSQTTKLETTNGSMAFTGKVGNLVADSAKDIYVNHLEANQLNASAQNDIIMKNVKISDEGHISTRDGFIHLKASLAMGDLELKNGKGMIFVDSSNIAGNADIASGKGFVKIKDTLFQKDASIALDNGGVNISKAHFMKDLDIKNNNGRTSIENTYLEQALEINSNGSISVDHVNIKGKVNIENEKCQTTVQNAFLQGDVVIKQNKGDALISDASLVENLYIQSKNGTATLKNAQVKGKVTMVGCDSNSTIKDVNIKKDVNILNHAGQVKVEAAHLEKDLNIIAHKTTVNVSKISIDGSANFLGDKTDVILQQAFVKKDVNVALLRGDTSISQVTVKGNTTVVSGQGDAKIDNALLEKNLKISLKNGDAYVTNTTVYGKTEIND